MTEVLPTIALAVICFLALLFIIGIILFQKQKWNRKRYLKKVEQENQRIKLNEKKLRKQGKKPFTVRGNTIWARSYKEAINYYNKEAKS